MHACAQSNISYGDTEYYTGLRASNITFQLVFLDDILIVYIMLLKQIQAKTMWTKGHYSMGLL